MKIQIETSKDGNDKLVWLEGYDFQFHIYNESSNVVFDTTTYKLLGSFVMENEQCNSVEVSTYGETFNVVTIKFNSALAEIQVNENTNTIVIRFTRGKNTIYYADYKLNNQTVKPGEKNHESRN